MRAWRCNSSGLLDQLSPTKAAAAGPDPHIHIEYAISDRQKTIVRRVLDLIASRYAPDLSPAQREKIVQTTGVTKISFQLSPYERAQVEIVERFLDFTFKLGLGATVTSLAAWSYLRSRQRSRIGRRALLGVAATSGLLSYLLRLKETNVEAAMHAPAIETKIESDLVGAVNEGRVVFPLAIARRLDTGPGFWQISFHEFVHLFGMGAGNFCRIPRTEALVQGYTLLFLLRQGGWRFAKAGFREVYGDKEFEASLNAILEPVHFGQVDNPAVFDQPHRRRIEQWTGHGINLDATSDVPKYEGSAIANILYSLGQAAIGWKLAHGDPSTAFDYLDAIGRGLDVPSAMRLIEREAIARRAFWNESSVREMQNEARDRFARKVSGLAARLRLVGS